MESSTWRARAAPLAHSLRAATSATRRWRRALRQRGGAALRGPHTRGRMDGDGTSWARGCWPRSPSNWRRRACEGTMWTRPSSSVRLEGQPVAHIGVDGPRDGAQRGDERPTSCGGRDARDGLCGRGPAPRAPGARQVALRGAAAALAPGSAAAQAGRPRFERRWSIHFSM